MKQPQLITMTDMYELLNPSERASSNLVFSHNLAVVDSLTHMFELMRRRHVPLLLEDYRMGMVKRGRVRAIINLQEYDVEAGTMVYITPGTIVEPLWASPDFEVMGMGVSRETFLLANHNALPPLFNGQMRDGRRPINGEQQQLLATMFAVLKRTAARHSEPSHTALCMVAAIASLYDDLFALPHPADDAAQKTTTDIFDRFIYLVNLNCRSERNLAFYASRMCITERYLGTVVRQTSGVTAKTWIDRAVITAAKVMLRHGNEQVTRIADELHFANTSFFCKYFKRLAGCTPQQYRQHIEG